MRRHLLCAVAFLVTASLQLAEARSVLDNYVVIYATRCVGTKRIGSPGDTPEMCASICLNSTDCAGFNYANGVSLCVARSVGCSQTSDTNSAFYRKQIHNRVKAAIEGAVIDTDNAIKTTASVQATETVTGTTIAASTTVLPVTTLAATTLPATTASAITTTAAQVQTSTPVTTDAPVVISRIGVEWASKFTKETGNRCAGGTRVGDPQDDIDQCAVACAQTPNCIGFNYNIAMSNCIARATDCSEGKDDGFIFYRRKGAADLSASATATASAPTTIAPPQAPVTTAPLPTVAATTAAIPLTSTTKAVGKVATASNLDNFQLLSEKRCAGKRLGDISSTLEKCAADCLELSDCVGFNFMKDSATCAGRGSDCLQVDDVGIDFYQKKSSLPLPPVSKTTDWATNPPAVTIAFVPPEITTLAPPPGADGSMSNYDVITEKRCVQGAVIGDRTNLVAKCATICNYSPDCVGFNFRESDSSCLAVGACTQIDDKSAIFYQKKVIASAAPITTTSSLPARSSAADTTVPVSTTIPPAITTLAAATTLNPVVATVGTGFTIKQGTRCTGGTSKPAGASDDLDKCTKLCKTNSACYGFNYSTSTKVCVLRTSGCLEEDAEAEVSFYKKNISS